MSIPDNFPRCLQFVLDREGGYVDNPRDPGGATNHGVTMQTLANWRGVSVTKQDVMNMGVDEAGAIYKKNYWDACSCDSFPPQLAIVLFDAAVNSGNFRSMTFMQAALGVAPDGRGGPTTLAAAAACHIPDTVRAALQHRLSFLQRLPAFATFGRGWTARIEALEAASLNT